MGCLRTDAHLPAHERKPLAEFQKESLEFRDDGRFHFFLGDHRVFGQSQEFQHIRIFDEVGWTLFFKQRFFFQRGLFVLRGEQAFVIQGVDVAFEDAGTPVLFGGLGQVIFAGFGVFHAHDEAVVSPGQFGAQ